MTEFPPEYIIGNKKNPLCRSCKKQRYAALRERWAHERAVRKDIPKEKQCRCCGQFKSLSAFTESCRLKHGLYSICKACQAKKSRELKTRWKKERKKASPPEEKLCTRCYKIFPIAQFCENVSHKDGYDTICKDCLKKRIEQYAGRWIKERKNTPQHTKKRCPGCNRTLPVSQFWAHEKRKDGYTNYCIACHKRIVQENIEKWEKQREHKPVVVYKKECTICHRKKPLTAFYPNRRYKDGYVSTCIACEERRAQEYMRQWAQKRSSDSLEKQCLICERVLPLDQFVLNKRKKDGRSSMCRECERNQRQEYAQRWEHKRKVKGSEGFSLYPAFEKTCSVCRETKPIALFHPQKYSKDGHESACMECVRKSQRAYAQRITALPKVIPLSKFCTSCNRMLPSSAFNRCNQRKDGLNNYCRECSNRRQREYLAKPEIKKRIREWERNYQRKPDVAAKRRIYARRYYHKPEVKAKAAVYRKQHRAKPEVKQRKSEQDKQYYQRKKKEKRGTREIGVS